MKNNNCSDCSEKTVEGRAVIDKETGPSLTLLEKRNFINADKIWLFL